jgi:hypothetical protein
MLPHERPQHLTTRISRIHICARAAGRILSRRAVRRRGKTGVLPRSAPITALTGASQNAPCVASERDRSGEQSGLTAVGDMRRQRTCERRDTTRQTGKHFVGENAGQVTDLHPTAQACAAGTPDLTGSRHLSPEKCFPAPSSGSPSRMSPAADHDPDTDLATSKLTCCHRLTAASSRWQSFDWRWPGASLRPGPPPAGPAIEAKGSTPRATERGFFSGLATNRRGLAVVWPEKDPS